VDRFERLVDPTPGNLHHAFTGSPLHARRSSIPRMDFDPRHPDTNPNSLLPPFLVLTDRIDIAK
jgi:hypothetical protein